MTRDTVLRDTALQCWNTVHLSMFVDSLVRKKP
jgi:hypothetical protein